MIGKYYLPNIEGYNLFNHRIHQHMITGLIHGICTPIAGIGIFMIIFAINILLTRRFLLKLSPAERTKRIMYVILGFYLSGYLSYSPGYGLITVLFYWYIINKTINRVHYNHSPTYNIYYKYDDIKTQQLFIKGVMFLLFSVCGMEFIGHWLIEGEGSNVSLLFNSIYHTPLYGVKNILNFIDPGISNIYKYLLVR